jgi:hypothetical protein
MCSCNKGSKGLPRRFNSPDFRGTRSPDVRMPKGPIPEMTSPNPSGRVTNIQTNPMNFEKIRIDRLRRNAIEQAKKQ